MGLRSGEFADHSSFLIKFGRFFLHHCWVAFAVRAGEGRTAFVREKLSFYRLFCCRSTAEKRLHFFLKDFCDITLCRYNIYNITILFVPVG